MGDLGCKQSSSHFVTHKSAGSPHWYRHQLDQGIKIFLMSQNNFVVIVFQIFPEMLGRGNIPPGNCSLKHILWNFMKEESKVFIKMIGR